jgi:hypothetical protein
VSSSAVNEDVLKFIRTIVKHRDENIILKRILELISDPAVHNGQPLTIYNKDYFKEIIVCSEENYSLLFTVINGAISIEVCELDV